MIDVHCSGCWRKIGVSVAKNPNKYRVYCDERCAVELPVTVASERADAWQFLYCKGLSPVAIAHIYGSPHGLVYKTLDRLATPVEAA